MNAAGQAVSASAPQADPEAVLAELEQALRRSGAMVSPVRRCKRSRMPILAVIGTLHTPMAGVSGA